MRRRDKIVLGTLVSTAVIGLGAGAFAGFCYAHDIEPAALTMDIRNCALILPVLSIPIGGVVGMVNMEADRDEGITQSHGEILDGIETLVGSFCTAGGYGILAAVSTGVGYGLGYLAGHLTR